ncbi:MAG: hypothetical protein ABI806_12405 [Candidatus Solibacter sp.]
MTSLPALLAGLVGSEFYFLANSGWGEYDAKGARKPGPPVQSAVRKIDVRKIKMQC